jgi:hypothetical protein
VHISLLTTIVINELDRRHDGGGLVLDARTVDRVPDIPVDGFVRLNSAANGRHVLVSQSDGFAARDELTGVEG